MDPKTDVDGAINLSTHQQQQEQQFDNQPARPAILIVDQQTTTSIHRQDVSLSSKFLASYSRNNFFGMD